MFSIPLKDYLRDEEKYNDYDEAAKKLVNKHYNSMIININMVEYEKKNGEIFVIPKYVKNMQEKFLSEYPQIKVDDWVVTIDENKDKFMKNKSVLNNNVNVVHLSPDSYISLDKYVVSDRQNWFNKLVLEFLKEHSGKSGLLIFSGKIDKIKSIMKKISSDEDIPIEHKRRLELFEMVGLDDIRFENFIKRKYRKEQN